nr:vascular non-inflammatory molecule 3-like [Procambarus clarkii]
MMFIGLVVVLVGLPIGHLCTSHTTQGEVRVSEGSPVVYVAAVLEYEPYNLWTEDGGGEAIVRENSRVLAEYTALAKAQGVDILVAPEYGVESLNMHPFIPDDLFSLMLFVPDPDLRVTPCAVDADLGHVEALRALSCAALENEIYLVVDLGEASPCRNDTAGNNPFQNVLDTSYKCPERGYIYYNSQVVFDRSGTVIARYRKKNLYLEASFKPGTESDETAIFTTDFGVTFTLQVCFDIAFFHPGVNNVVTHGITDVVMSTAWVDLLPFTLAPPVQNTWSRELGVNLMVSGYHLPERAKLGSGIYRGFSDLSFTYTYDPDSGNQMIVSEVETVASVSGKYRPSSRVPGMRHIKLGGKTKVMAGGSVEAPSAQGRHHQIYYDDLSNYTQVVLPQGGPGETQQVEACHQDGLCCTLTYSLTSSLNYSLLAYSGIISEGDGVYKIYAQVCAVVWCHTEDINTCARVNDGLPQNDEFGPFTISGNFSINYVYPSIFTRNLTLVANDQYTTTNDRGTRTITTQEPTPDLLSTFLYGRWYDRDP